VECTKLVHVGIENIFFSLLLGMRVAASIGGGRMVGEHVALGLALVLAFIEAAMVSFLGATTQERPDEGFLGVIFHITKW
jgi:hypothetical protein